jgi:hypothetical protein
MFLLIVVVVVVVVKIRRRKRKQQIILMMIDNYYDDDGEDDDIKNKFADKHLKEKEKMSGEQANDDDGDLVGYLNSTKSKRNETKRNDETLI